MMFQSVWFATLPQLILLYSVELATLIYLWRKYGTNRLYILLILLFYPAVFAFMGTRVNDGYKILVLAIALWITVERGAIRFVDRGDGLITASFLLFTFFYAISAIYSKDSPEIILSQYSRYLIAFCLWFLVRQELYAGPDEDSSLRQFAYDVILMQIVITIGKFVIFGGRQIESIVGSLSHIGGAAGTTIPVLGFVALWLYREGTLKKKDWAFVAGLLLIGLLAGKRAVWFVLPIEIAAFMIYVPGIEIKRALVTSLVVAPLVFYLGARLIPTLNPDNKVWGSFDIEYTLKYAVNYQFGNKDGEAVAQGRGGAARLVMAKYASGQLNRQDWFGRGMAAMYATSYKEFNELDTGINMKGSASGVFQSYITTGLLGVVATVLLALSFLFRIRMRRLRWVITCIMAWEYFLYTGSVMRTPAFMFLIIYFIHYSNYVFERETTDGYYEVDVQAVN